MISNILSKKVNHLFCLFLVKNNRFLKSFTLPELAIAISVAGIIATAGMMAYKSTNPEVKQDLKKIKAIEDKLQEFFNANGRLPFPANPAENASNANYLTEAIYRSAYNATSERYMCTSQTTMTNGSSAFSGTCSSGSTHCCPGNFVVWGVVPTRTLGLPDDYAYDHQGHNFEFITHSALAFKINDPFNDTYYKKDYQTSNDGKYDVLFQASGKTDKKIILERLSVYNNKTAKQIGTTANNTAYVIMSKGKTNKCFFNTRTSTSVNSTKPTGNLLKNCVSNYTNNSATERTIYQGYSKDFDNIVKYKTINDIIYAKANAEEAKNEMTQGRVISYQPRDDTHLQTASKNLIGAINELKANYDSLLSKYNSLKAEKDALQARVDKVQSANYTSKLFMLGATAQETQPTTRSISNVYMENGTLYLTKTTDLSGTANNKPALIVGGTDTGAHLEFDGNEIQAKNNGTTTAPLYINNDGGDTYLNYVSGNTHLSRAGHTYVGESITNGNLYIGKSGGSSKIYLNGQVLNLTDTVLTKAQVCNYVYPVGSVYINSSKTDNPNTLLGCGTWELVPRNYYIRSANANGAVNYATRTLASLGSLTKDSALPNIRGVMRYISETWATSGEAFDAFTKFPTQWIGNNTPAHVDSSDASGMQFMASKYNSTYTQAAESKFSLSFSDTNISTAGCAFSESPTHDVKKYLCPKHREWCESHNDVHDVCDYEGSYLILSNNVFNVFCNCKDEVAGHVQTPAFNVMIWRRTA